MLTKEAYEADPKSYWNSLPQQNTPLWENYIISDLPDSKGRGLCLDLGCGGGLYLQSAAAHFQQIIGIDFSEPNLEIARTQVRSAKLDNVELYNADLGDIRKILNNSVDFAYSVAVFMHMPSEAKRRALKELRRVLKSEGRVILIEIVPIEGGAFDCPDIKEEEWLGMINDAGMVLENAGPADPFKKHRLCRRK